MWTEADLEEDAKWRQQDGEDDANDVHAMSPGLKITPASLAARLVILPSRNRSKRHGVRQKLHLSERIRS